MSSPFDKLRKSLSKTKAGLFGRISQVIRRRKIDDDLIDDIEEILIEADVGIKASMRLVDALRDRAGEGGISDGDAVMELLKNEIVGIMSGRGDDLFPPTAVKPIVWLITGVNGVGKTTTIGKLAARFASEGKKVMIGACDTFRAAAIDQVAIWAERSGVDIIRSQEGADPASVAFDAACAAGARGVDILLVDTAGRLHEQQRTGVARGGQLVKRVLDPIPFCRPIGDGHFGFVAQHVFGVDGIERQFQLINGDAVWR